ncbi:MAG TPA: class I SAM-dependent methyltransferase [Pirellulales bacterium]|nr:class I SAM-dependent methyltransferase [Pirellulales bacterium]
MLSSLIRIALNRALNPIGLSIGTTRLETNERTRLDAADARGHWNTPRYDQGLALDDAAFLQFLDTVCRPFQSEYSALPERLPEGQVGYFLRNPWFGPVDAEVLYSMLRHHRPKRVIEVGSGFSSRLTRRAIADGQLETRLTCIDPSPCVEVRSFADEYIASLVETLSVEQIVGPLTAGDFLFIDSSHLVATAGDVPFLFLEVLPRLAPGVIVHVHDIFFPYDYPKQWVIDHRWGWNEQYLVHALLMGNRSLGLLWPAWYMWQKQRRALEEVIPSARGGAFPTSLWLRINERS